VRLEDILADIDYQESLVSGKPVCDHEYGKDAVCIFCGQALELCAECRYWQWHAAGGWGCYRPPSSGFDGVIFPMCFKSKD